MRKKRGRLLARLGALVALSAAGAGCQSVPLLNSLMNHGADASTRTVAVAPPIVIGPSRSSTPALELPTTRQVAWQNPDQEASHPIPVVSTSNWTPLARDSQEPRTMAASTWRTARAASDFSESVIPANLEPPQAATPSTDVKKPEGATPPAESPVPGPRPLMVIPNQPMAGVPMPPMSHGGMGPHGGRVPFELAKMALPPYIVEPPDVLLVEAKSAVASPDQRIAGQHLVRPDGTINLGIYGSVFVQGMTLEQIRGAIAARLTEALPERKGGPVKPEDISVDVLAYNSKVYYIITDGGGYGEQVYRQPITGSETVLDAISLINGLPPVASKKKIWVARRVPDNSHGGYYNNILPVDWCSITKGGATSTNYQILPGDRIYVAAEKIIHVDSTIAKFVAPIERLLGVTLLGSETVNSIRNRGSGTGTTP